MSAQGLIDWGTVAVLYSFPLLVLAFFLARKAHPARSRPKAFLTAFGILAGFFFGTIATLVALAFAGAAILDATGVSFDPRGPHDVIGKGLIGVAVGGIIGAIVFGYQYAKSRMALEPKP
jgi:hypothetical protein